jgi:nitrogenase molybdenum-cofactor synthesis protein NifE
MERCQGRRDIMQLYKYLPLPSDRMGTLWALTSIKDACIVEYGPAGTTHYGIEGFMKLNADLRAKLYTTHMDESDIVMGDSTRLEETLKEVDSVYKPRVIFVVASSISSIIGTDIENVCDNLRDEVNAKLICFSGGGFRGDYTLGIKEVLTALAKHVVRECNEKKEKSFNIIGSNVECYNFLSDIKEIENLMKQCFGYTLNAVFTANSSLEEIENAAAAHINLVLRNEGLECAQILKDNYGIPYVEGSPYGLKGTMTWIKNVEEVLSEKADEIFLSKQTEKARKNIFKFKHSIMMYRKLNTILSGNYDFIIDILPLLKDELSLEIGKAFVNHNIRASNCRKLTEDESALTLINPTEFDREENIKSLKPDIILGDAITMEISNDTPIKLQVSNPNMDRINLYEYTPFMGFNGVSYIIEMLLNEISKNSSKLKARF